ncbi:hypothetical protein RV134_260353 [Roseovarius sp. EC-HK134]|nr:hypothetical protein RV134_260353 [Roseovarius sp. EC-HK134]VVT11208.1 hypothetical protein RV420_290568 [Roseovarius sp. EC-SD190]
MRISDTTLIFGVSNEEFEEEHACGSGSPEPDFEPWRYAEPSKGWIRALSWGHHDRRL